MQTVFIFIFPTVNIDIIAIHLAVVPFFLIFYWPGMDKVVEDWLQLCSRYIGFSQDACVQLSNVMNPLSNTLLFELFWKNPRLPIDFGLRCRIIRMWRMYQTECHTTEKWQLMSQGLHKRMKRTVTVFVLKELQYRREIVAFSGNHKLVDILEITLCVNWAPKFRYSRFYSLRWERWRRTNTKFLQESIEKLVVLCFIKKI